MPLVVGLSARAPSRFINVSMFTDGRYDIVCDGKPWMAGWREAIMRHARDIGPCTAENRRHFDSDMRAFATGDALPPTNLIFA